MTSLSVVHEYRRRGIWGACVAVAAFAAEFLSFSFPPTPARSIVILASVTLLILAWGFSVWNVARAKGYSYTVAGVLTFLFPPATILLLFLPNLNKVSSARAREEDERRKALGYCAASKEDGKK